MSLFNPEKMFTYIKGMAQGLNWKNTLKALYIAREGHQGQTRKDGTPYIVHPLAVACHLIALGKKEDEIIATALLHDWKEDCKGDLRDLHCSTRIKHNIDYLTFDINQYHGADKAQALAIYYDVIKDHRIASLVKASDRCNNVSDMAAAFSSSKVISYEEETRQYVLPLINHAKNTYPSDSDAFFAMKYHILAILDTIDAMRASNLPKSEM